MKELVLCDSHCYHITDEDYETLKIVSPGFARLARNSESQQATHFVCEHCGQVPPIKLRTLHKCKSKDDNI